MRTRLSWIFLCLWSLGTRLCAPTASKPTSSPRQYRCYVLRAQKYTYSCHTVHTQYTQYIPNTQVKKHGTSITRTVLVKKHFHFRSIPFFENGTVQNGTERYGRACAIERSRKILCMELSRLCPCTLLRANLQWCLVTGMLRTHPTIPFHSIRWNGRKWYGMKRNW